MSGFSVFMIAIGLSMDACAVSFAKGMCLKKHVIKYAIILAVAFGTFQALMPLLGWWIGTYFESFITAVDHWIAFLLLGFIGLNMIKEAREHSSENATVLISLPWSDILLMAIATSIDALAVGVSFAFLQVNIVFATFLIGITTFMISLFAVILGNRLGGHLGKYAELTGGIILIFIGIKILTEHLLG